MIGNRGCDHVDSENVVDRDGYVEGLASLDVPVLVANGYSKNPLPILIGPAQDQEVAFLVFSGHPTVRSIILHVGIPIAGMGIESGLLRRRIIRQGWCS